MIGRPRRSPTKSQSGYALLVVMFFLALLVVSLTVVRSSLIFQDRREKELEMIWRGKQYARAIRLYYQKTRRYPAEMNDLCKPNMGIRFMRKEYKDPLNTADGSWRLIYVGPAGQLVGSLTQPVAAQPTNASKPNPSARFLDTLSAPPSSPKDPLGSLTASPAGGLQPLTASDSGLPSTSSPIIGVGSKINKRSIIWMDGWKDYLHFEFIFRGQVVDPRTVTPDP